MADRDKGRNPDQDRKKSAGRLVKLNGKSGELYDSYGYQMQRPKPAPAAPPKEPKKTAEPDRQRRASAAGAAARQDAAEKPQQGRTRQQAKPAGRPYAPKDQARPSHEKRIAERTPKRKRAMATAIKAAVFLILVGVAILLIIYNQGEKAGGVKTAFVTTGTIENSFSVDVNIIRDEFSVSAASSGKLIAAVNEGDRVAVDSVIAYVVQPEYENDLNTLRDIEDKITTAQNAASYINTSQSAELNSMNTDIEDLTSQLSALSGTPSNLESYSEVMQKLKSVFRMKNDIMMNAETADTYITNLKNQRSEVLAKLGSSMHEIKAQQAGVVSFYVGSGGQNASEKAKDIANYISKKGSPDNALPENMLLYGSAELRNMVGGTVSENDIVARITPDVTYYLTADVTNLDYSRFTPGKQIGVKAATREFSVEATIIEVLQYDGRVYLLMQSSNGIAGTISKNVVKSDIIVDYSEGIKVPKRALTEWDAAGLTARITIVRSNYVSYVYVNVLAEDGEYAIINNTNGFASDTDEGVKSVRINDLYVVNYETVTEGQIIGG